MTSKPKIVTLAASFLFVLAVAVFLLTHFSADNKVKDDDFCQPENSEHGKCVEENRCGDVILTETVRKPQCKNGLEKICCPSHLIFPSETPANIKPSILYLGGEVIPVERVGRKPANGLVRTFQNDVKCGTSSADKILLGTAVKPGEFPFFVSLHYRNDSDPTGKSSILHCGGSLISNRYVLTAAHCILLFHRIDPSSITARVGELDLTKETDCEGCYPSVEHKIEKILIHSEYNKTRKGFDIALLRLSEPVSFNPFVKPVCLPTEEKNRLDESLMMEVMGFGLTEFGNFSDVLLKTAVPFVPLSECNRIYKKALRGSELRAGHLCAGSEPRVEGIPRPDSCILDSGGPLIAARTLSSGNSRMFQYGIVSFGFKECGKAPGVYTDVYEQIGWIADNVE